MNQQAIFVAVAGAALLGGTNDVWSSQCEAGLLAPADGRAEQEFGAAVAIGGPLAIVGAAEDDANGTGSGAAYIFHWSGKAWTQEQKLTARDATEDSAFGGAVAIDGTVALVGARRDGERGDDAGAAYVFRRQGTGWVETQKLTARDGSPFGVFGVQVAIEGDTAVVAAWDDNENGPSAGSVYVFRYDGKTWTEEQKITPADGRPNRNFGWSVALSGDVLVVGVPLDDDLGNRAGAAYVFRFDGATWVEEKKLMHPRGESLDFFGDCVAVDGSAVVVGAWGDDEEESSAGSTHVFRYDNGAWKVEQMLTAGDASPLAGLGTSVAVKGDVIICGASGDRELAGSAYVFRHDGERWNEVSKLVAADGAPDDRFGASVAMSDDAVLVGAQYHDENGVRSGVVYAFEYVACDCVADIDGDGEVGFEDILTILDSWGNQGGPADLDGSGTVDDHDLNIALSAWGPCHE